MRRILIWLLLVIVLVSLHWFRVLVAQDLSSLSDEEKNRLSEWYRSKPSSQGESHYYESPEFFERTSLTGPDSQANRLLPIDSTSYRVDALSVHRDQAARSLEPDGSGLPAFSLLRPFGLEFFEAEQQASPAVDIASADDYILGPGDNVIIYLWGRVEKQYNLTVDREGKLFIPTVGELVVWGETLEQFREKAKKQFSRVYSDFDLTCSLGKVRSLRIYVTGEVRKPGAYTISSLTSLFNALCVAGGPNDLGSMRNIKLMRKGKCKAIVDLYQLLLAGDNSTDIRLESGDVVFVPVAGARVAIRGQVKRSAIYELHGGETVVELLALAGNATAEAYLDRVMLERISERDEWEVLDLDLNPDNSDSLDDISLMDGDRITVFSIFEAKKNMVALFGRVKHPGYYERNDSTCVSDLIGQGQLQPYDVYYDRADLFRRHHDWRVEVVPLDLKKIMAGDSEADILLSDRDSVHIYSINEIEWEKQVYIEGEVKKPGWYPLYDGMTTTDLIFLAGSFTRTASRVRAELARVDADGEVSLTYISLGDNTADQTCLIEDDHLYVRQIPRWQENRSVTIEGEVDYPGRYMLSSHDETLYQLVQRAGGFTPNAFPKGIILERTSIEENLQRTRVPQLLAKSQPLVEDSLNNTARRQVFEYDLGSMNRIIIDVEKMLATRGAERDVVLEPDDRIYVPSIPSGVSIMGAVGANGTLSFVENKNARYYIKRAGDFSRQADKGETRLIRAGGEVISGGRALSQRVELGDVIVVPTRIQKDRDWGKTLTTALSAITGALTTVYIVSNL